MAKKKKVTFDYQNQISSSWSPSGRLCHMSRDAAFMRMGQRAITSVEADALKSFLELSVTSCGFHQLAQLTHRHFSCYHVA